MRHARKRITLGDAVGIFDILIAACERDGLESDGKRWKARSTDGSFEDRPVVFAAWVP